MDLEYLCLTKHFLYQKYDFTLLGLSDAILSNTEIGGTCKVCILTALK